jgi:UDP-N-acetylglucosamine 2-epimerase (non-hydrolysing)
MKKKVFLVFGTRPEAIKMAPLALELARSEKLECKVILTAQHREMLDQVIEFFEIKAAYDLDLMKANQTLFDITANVMHGLKDIFEKDKPDVLLVHGDTTTTMAATLAAYYFQIPVGHVEAGLRTGNIYSPFPEEINRKVTGSVATYHFSPTEGASDNLKKENTNPENIIVTGNTVIDALFLCLSKIKDREPGPGVAETLEKAGDRKIILVTGHRRESFGDGFLQICNALKEIAEKNSDVEIIYPVHLNPNVRKPVFELLSGLENIQLIEPVDYPSFCYLMDKAYILLTDSGGIQEEGPSLGKPVLVMRDTTERPEAIDAGTVKLVGTDRKIIVDSVQELLDDGDSYKKMSESHNPYGDGKACTRIRGFLEDLSNG